MNFWTWRKVDTADMNTKLLEACTFRQVHLARQALRKGARVDCRRCDYLTPLHIAAEHGDVELINLICDQPDTLIEIQTMHGLTALHTSVLLGHKEATETLLNRGAEPNAEDNLERRPLYYAALQKDSETALMLLKHGANVNVYDAFRETPLYTSTIRRPCLNMINLLLQHGASATLGPTEDSLGLLLEAILSVTNSADRKIVKLLLKHCSNVNFRDNVGLRTPLHITAISGDEPLTQYLLEIGGDPQVKNRAGQTPIQVAQQYRNFHIVELIGDFLHNRRASELSENTFNRERDESAHSFTSISTTSLEERRTYSSVENVREN